MRRGYLSRHWQLWGRGGLALPVGDACRDQAVRQEACNRDMRAGQRITGVPADRRSAKGSCRWCAGQGSAARLGGQRVVHGPSAGATQRHAVPQLQRAARAMLLLVLRQDVVAEAMGLQLLLLLLLWLLLG